MNDLGTVSSNTSDRCGMEKSRTKSKHNLRDICSFWRSLSRKKPKSLFLAEIPEVRDDFTSPSLRQPGKMSWYVPTSFSILPYKLKPHELGMHEKGGKIARTTPKRIPSPRTEWISSKNNQNHNMIHTSR